MNIEVGQVWEDTDPRSVGRTVEVRVVKDGFAIVRLNTMPHDRLRQSIGRRTKIRLDRFPVDYKLSDVLPHRFGVHFVTGELGYWPQDGIAGGS